MIPDTLYTISISLAPFALAVLALLTLGATYLAIAEERGAAPARPAPAASAQEFHLLRKRLAHSRMSRMLARLGIAPLAYLEDMPAAQVREQLETCAACPHQFRCDEALACNRAVKVDLSFCPNQAEVLRLARA